LVRGRGALPQDRVRLIRDIFNLNTWHSAILAPQAPDSNHPTFGMSVRLWHGGATHLHRSPTHVLDVTPAPN
jgi:hypothetical protein